MAAAAIWKKWHDGSGGHFVLIISWYWWTERTAEGSCHQLMTIFIYTLQYMKNIEFEGIYLWTDG